MLIPVRLYRELSLARIRSNAFEAKIVLRYLRLATW